MPRSTDYECPQELNIEGKGQQRIRGIIVSHFAVYYLNRMTKRDLVVISNENHQIIPILISSNE